MKGGTVAVTHLHVNFVIQLLGQRHHSSLRWSDPLATHVKFGHTIRSQIDLLCEQPGTNAENRNKI